MKGSAASRLRRGKYERVVNLAGFRGTGTLSSAWLGIAPDGSPMILKDVGNQEIYVLEWKAP